MSEKLTPKELCEMGACVSMSQGRRMIASGLDTKEKVKKHMDKKKKNEHIHRASNLIERLLWEQPEDEVDFPGAEEEPEAEAPAPEDEETPDVEEEPEQGQAEQVEVYFNNLDEQSQKVLMDALKENLNVADDDEYAKEKIVEILSKQPIYSFRAEDLVRKLNIDI